jgi:hypothetical protein
LPISALLFSSLLFVVLVAVAPAAAAVVNRSVPSFVPHLLRLSHIFDLLVAADRSPSSFEYLAASGCRNIYILGFVSHRLHAKRFCSLAGASEVFDICCSYLLLLLLLLGFSCNV